MQAVGRKSAPENGPTELAAPSIASRHFVGTRTLHLLEPVWTYTIPADAFVDPEGYRAYIDTAEAEFRSGRTYSRTAAGLYLGTTSLDYIDQIAAPETFRRRVCHQLGPRPSSAIATACT